MKTIKLFVMAFVLLAISQSAGAQVTTAQIREQIAKGECETAQALYNVYKAMNGANKTIEREIADCKTDSSSGFGGTGTANGHEYVDLDLPSGTLWATCNVGASKPEDGGSNFAWGETTEKSNYNLETYKYFNGSSGKVTKYCNDSYYGDRGFTDNLKSLQSSDDPATANCGSGWHTPTKAQWEELINYTIHEWKEQNGTDGMLFTAKNGRTLFLPIVGYRWGRGYLYSGASPYWSMSLYTDCPSDAWCISINKNGCHKSQGNRGNGFHVRPVRKK